MILGTLADVCAYTTSRQFIKGSVKLTGNALTDKFIIPIGTFIISSMVGYEAEKYVNEQVEETKKIVKAVKETIDERKMSVQEEVSEKEQEENKVVITNVFDNADKEDEENGEGGDA